MSKKSNKNAAQGTYALCITVGLIVGLGLGPVLGSVLLGSAVGATIGLAAGYFFNHLKKRHKH